MSIVVKEVVSKKDLKKWVDFPNKMYKKVDAYVPFMFNDEMDTFNKEKNPAYEFCETRLFLAYKGPQAEDDISEAKRAIDILGGKVVDKKEYNLPDSDINHSVISVKKLRQTPPAYPRKAGKPSKEPLK